MIDNKERIAKLNGEEYQQIFGVKQATFERMLGVLESAYQKLHAQGGKPPKLSVLDKLVIALCYWREYRTYRHIAFDYGVGKTAVGDSIRWVEDTLLRDSSFTLPSRLKYERSGSEIETLVVDVTEQEIERPKRGKRNGIPAKRSATP